jgi:predicted RNA-binding protein with PIN domain
MNYIIDGHNLIATLPGWIYMPDDEQRLISCWCALANRGGNGVEVYFDGAETGQAGERNFGRVKAYFAPQLIGDQAIRIRLQRLRGDSRNWVVVTSDRAVQATAREVHAQVLRAEDFASQLQADLLHTSLRLGSAGNEPPAEASLSEEEVEEWLELFKRRGKRS